MFLRKKTSWKGAALAGLVLVLLAGLLSMACSDSNDSSKSNIAGDSLPAGLIGEWSDGSGYEYFTITANHLLYEAVDWVNMDYADPDYGLVPMWGGSIVYVSSFNAASGIIIIKYDEGLEQVWMDWDTYMPLDPQPAGKYYGIYYDNLTEDTVNLSSTTDQDPENSGPTETSTLAEAIARFTEADKALWVNISYVGSSTEQTRVEK